MTLEELLQKMPPRPELPEADIERIEWCGSKTEAYHLGLITKEELEMRRLTGSGVVVYPRIRLVRIYSASLQHAWGVKNKSTSYAWYGWDHLYPGRADYVTGLQLIGAPHPFTIIKGALEAPSARRIPHK